MKLNEKVGLFLIATFTTFYGISNELLKKTEAKEILQEDIVLNENTVGLTNVIINGDEIKIDSDIYNYNIKVENFKKLLIIPMLANGNDKYTMNVIGNAKTDESLIVIINVKDSLNNEKIYTIFIEKNKLNLKDNI